MKIRRLTVRNFRGLDEKSLDFTDASGRVRPLTVIVGPNRSGKTTFLDALHLVYASLVHAREPAFRPEFDPDDPRLRPDPNRPIEVEIVWSLDEPDEWHALIETSLALDDVRPPWADEYSLTFHWPRPDEGQYGIVRQSPDYANLAIRGRGQARVGIARRVVAAALIERIGGLLYLDQRRAIDQNRNLSRTTSQDDMAQWATAGDILPWIELQARLDVRWDPEAKGKSGWTRLKEIFARIARPSTIDDMEPFPEGYDLRFRDTRSDQIYYLAGTSSGERMLLRIVASLTAFGPRRSVVMIDEIEQHLHPRWQRNLLHFCKTGYEGDTQFIVTTHSDGILRYVDPAAVVTLGDLDR